MLVLRREEVNERVLEERFEKHGGKYHEVPLGFPPGMTFRTEEHVHPKDWPRIIPSIEADYVGSVFPLIVVSSVSITAYNMKRVAKCFTDTYTLKI